MERTKITQEVYKERDEICSPLTIGQSASMRKAKDCITYFAYHQLGVTPYTWQHLFFKQVMKNNKDILVCTPRQVGKSMSLGIIALHHTLYNILPIQSKGNRTIIGIVSRSELQSRKIISDIRNLMDMGDRHIEKRYGVKSWFNSHLSTKQTDTNSKTHLTFRRLVRSKDKKGKVPEGNIIGEIIAVPATESARGNTFSLLLMDEASFFEDDEFFSTVAEPTLRATKGHSIVTTTPNGQKGWFFQAFDPFDEHYESGKNPYKRIWLHYNHIEDEDEKKLILEKKKVMESMGMSKQFEQEYEASFTVDATSFFDAEKVDAMFDDTMAPYPDGYKLPTDLGVDIGFKTSRSVITVSRLGEDGVIRRIWHYRYPEKSDLSLVEDIIKLIPKYNVKRVVVDDCPAGSNLIQELQKRGVNLKLMNFRAEKTSKYVLFRSKLYQGKIKSYPDKLLSAEMKGLTESEGIYNTRIEKIKSMTDDVIDSFLISCKFYLEEKKGFRVYDIDEVE